MSGPSKALLFLFVNFIGFLSPSICYYAGVATGAISSAAPDFDPETFRLWFFPVIMATWLVCALFSFAFFFIHDRGRYIFLAAPIIVPIFYGLSVL